MPQPERRYDRLAVRLSLIISRLLNGETLSVRILAVEFGVSVRTLRRDFRERLMYLDLEYKNGLCRLVPGSHTSSGERDVLHFARQTGVSVVFPVLDSRLVNMLMNSRDDSPCIIYQTPLRSVAAPSESFHLLTRAITERLLVTLFSGGRQYERLAPYRLICLDGIWYLVCEYRGYLNVFLAIEITEVKLLKESFSRRDDLSRLTAGNDFITALPHFRFIHDVLKEFNSQKLA
ncbi:TPA: WYL domain-containing protein [Yersinia enterocolitica]|uniref:helix-turn-helix transcriptional regulator n=1 Tax=Serratia liquefaciens TaxID=614 RepID=UPI003309E4AF|nr:WYL domain-containing protein [Yersinia enterocolitica]